MMRILILTWRDIRHPEAGGSEVYLHELGRRWVSAGHDVIVVTSRAQGAARREVVDGIRCRRAGGRLTVYLHGLGYAMTRRRSTDLVVDVINGIPFGTPLVRRRGVIALVHHVHRTQWQIIYPGMKGRLGWFLESRLATRLYRGRPYVTVSQTSRNDLIALGVPPADVNIVPNGLTSRPNQGGPIELRARRIAVLARLVPHKQIEHVVLAAARLRATIPDLGVDLIGDGWWRDRLEAVAHEAGVEDMVKFHGRVSDDERDRLLAGARVMVLPSAKEGWGLAVTEAAAQGTPTVGYRSSGGLNESIVDGVTGLVVDDFDALVAAIEVLLADGPMAEKMSQAARERSTNVDWDDSAQALLRVWERNSRPREAVSGRRKR